MSKSELSYKIIPSQSCMVHKTIPYNRNDRFLLCSLDESTHAIPLTQSSCNSSIKGVIKISGFLHALGPGIINDRNTCLFYSNPRRNIIVHQ